MKPENWDVMSKDEKFDHARNLIDSPRGLVLVAEALSIAAKAMRNSGSESNAQDMELNAEAVFPVNFSQAKRMNLSIEKLLSDDQPIKPSRA